jgi:GNAT superfamily N-acetyltransferase
MYTLRAVRDDDAPRLAELLSIGQKEPVTAETIRNWRQTQSPERIATCLVATERGGRVVGYGQAVRDPWLPPADFFLYGVVDPATRRRGIGSLLFDAVVRFALEHGASILRCEVQEANPDGLRFARRHGFRIERYSSTSRLELSTFDERPFLRYVEQAEASGIRFLTLADVGDAAEPRRTYYEMFEDFVVESPKWPNSRIPSEQFEREFYEMPTYRAEAQVIAAAGQEWIGLTSLVYFEQSETLQSLMTGVVPAYRGRGIAQALKVLSIRTARRYGVSQIHSDCDLNDPTNAAMAAINRKLGYRSEPGHYLMVRQERVSAQG